MEKIWTGTLTKMKVKATDVVSYFLTDGHFEKAARNPDFGLNESIGHNLQISFSGNINCVACGRKTKKSFGQGFCFPCMRSRPEADICMVKPELCHYHEPEDPCRDNDFAHTHCFAPHVLYCSLTSGVKVGITRQPNVPSRWIDQGAVWAMPLAILPDRRAVGLVEKRLSDEGFKDKTHWTKMLKGNPDDINPIPVAEEILARLNEWQVEGVLTAEQRIPHTFVYPVNEWPKKVKSFNLDKIPQAGGVFNGIKGQYLIFDGGVINLRKYTGYQVEVFCD